MFPNLSQKLLLQAAIFPKSKAEKYLREWKKVGDVHDVDHGSYRVLPLIYHRLKPKGALGNTVKGILRHTWAKNAQIFHAHKPVFKGLSDKNIPFMILKGGALSLNTYDHTGLRAMLDLDLLVPENKAILAIDELFILGWKPKFLIQKVHRITPTFLKVFSAMTFVNKEKIECDLHWRVLTLLEDSSKGIEEDIWKYRIPFSAFGTSFFLPSDTDQLFHVCMHGSLQKEDGAIRWVLDAMQILKKKTIDWARLESLGEKQSLLVPLFKVMQYLYTEMDAPLPENWLKALEKRTENMKALYVPSSYKKSVIERIVDYKNRLKRVHGRSWFTFLFFLKRFYGLSSVFFVPFYVVYLHYLFFRKNGKPAKRKNF